MTTKACAEDWREIAEKAAREAREWRENFDVLQRALVGETGASGIEVAHALRKDAERYRKLCEAGGAIDAFVAAYHNTLVKEALDAAVDAVPAIRAA